MPLLVLEGHAGRVRACAFAAEGRLVISGSGDKSLRVWDATTGAEIMILCAPGGLLSCATSPRGGLLCCGDSGGNFSVLALKGSLSP
jgi:WD40 repeat protein